MRRLARRLSFNFNQNDVRTQWEKQIPENSTEEIRSKCTQLKEVYKKSKENAKKSQINDIFPFENDDNQGKTLDDYIKVDEKRKPNENETDLPTRYPKAQDDISEFYVQFNHNTMSIMKKRPYESNENSHEGYFPKKNFI